MRVTLPDRTDLGKHPQGGPRFLTGTWETTGSPVSAIRTPPPYAVVFMGLQMWISDDNGRWAYVTPDGTINGYVNLSPTELQKLTGARNTDGDVVFRVVWDPNQYVFVPANAPAVRATGKITCTLIQQSPATSSPWNGTCPRCGRGTYTGAFKVEHEGGGCSHAYTVNTITTHR